MSSTVTTPTTRPDSSTTTSIEVRARSLLVQVEDAAEQAGLAGVDVPAGVGLGDQALELIGRAAAAFEAHLDAEQAQDAVGERRQGDDEGAKGEREGVQRLRDAPRD